MRLRSLLTARLPGLLVAVLLVACAAGPPLPARPTATEAISPTEPAQAAPARQLATATPRVLEPTPTSAPTRAPTETNTPELVPTSTAVPAPVFTIAPTSTPGPPAPTPTSVAAPALAFAAAPTSTPKPLAPTPTWTARPPPTATALPAATSTPRPPPTATPIPPPAAPNVIIQYIRFDGVVPKTESDEYAVVFNAGASAVNLQGWRLNAGDPGQDFVFPVLTLAPGQACWVYTNETHPETCGLSFRRSQAIWNNKGDCGRLYRADGQLAHEKCY